MDLAYIVLLILFIIYIPIYMFVRKSDRAKEAGFVTWGPTIMIKTRWGLKLMDRWGRHKRFWGVFGAFSLIVSFLLMASIVAILVIDLSLIPSMISSGTSIGIEYALAIPGLNPALPLVYGIIGLVIAMVVHELAHGIQSRTNDVKVKSSGILYGVVPLGAFVEPDDDEVGKSSRRTRLHIFAAGITTNFIVAGILFILMFSMMNGMVTCDYEDNPAIYAESYDNGIPVSSIFTEIDGTPIDGYDGLIGYLKANGTAGLDTHNITYVYHDEIRHADLKTGVYLNTIQKGSPAHKANVPVGSFLLSISSVDGSQVSVLEVPTDFTDVISGTSPGEKVIVTYCDLDGVTNTAEVELGDNGGKGFFGASVTLSGMSLTTPDKVLQTGINPFYGKETLTDCAMGILTFIGAPFQGFSPVPESCSWWFDCDTLGNDVFWILIHIIFWTFWLNMVLAISNALPAIPFDGGYLFKDGLDWLIEKMGVYEADKRENLVNVFANFTSYLMLFALVLILVIMVL